MAKKKKQKRKKTKAFTEAKEVAEWLAIAASVLGPLYWLWFKMPIKFELTNEQIIKAILTIGYIIFVMFIYLMIKIRNRGKK